MASTKQKAQNSVGINKQEVEAIIDQAITRAIQVQREQVLTALTSGDKEKTRALRTIDALKLEISENLRKLGSDIQSRQDACKKDCNETITKSSPNYLAIIGLAITIASPFVAWVAKIQYDLLDIKVEIARQEENRERIKGLEMWVRDKAGIIRKDIGAPAHSVATEPAHVASSTNIASGS